MQRTALWRVCRVLANRHRLEMLGIISHRPGLRVSDIARAMKLSRPTTSQYLRALEACGVVAARRRGRSVVYELGGGQGAEAGIRILVKALIRRLTGKSAIETTFKLATAFANAGRIEVFNSLRSGSQSVGQLRAETGFPHMTLCRHLQKLQKRGFVRQRPHSKTYEIAPLNDGFARALADMVR